jgi:hypothetical protein
MEVQSSSLLGHKTTLQFSSSPQAHTEEEKEESQVIKALREKYGQADSSAQALRRAVAVISNEQGLLDIKFLIKACKGDIYNASSSGGNAGKTPLEICVKYTLEKLNSSVPNKKEILKIKLRTISFLLYLNESLNVLQAAKMLITDFFPGKEKEHFLFKFTLDVMFETAENNIQLQQQCKKENTVAPYAFQPILLCERHDNAGSFLFAKHILPKLKRMGYQMIGMEGPLGLGLNDVIDLLKSRLENEASYPKDMQKVHINMLKLFKTLEKQNILFESIDSHGYAGMQNSNNIEMLISMAMHQYDMGALIFSLRDKGMFYKLMTLANRYNGAVLGIVGSAHALGIIRLMTQTGMDPATWLKVAPSQDQASLSDLVASAKGALPLCLSEDNLANATEQLLKALKEPAAKPLIYNPSPRRGPHAY